MYGQTNKINDTIEFILYHFDQAPLPVKIVWIFIPFCFIVFIALIFRINALKINLRFKNSEFKKLNGGYQKLVVNYLFLKKEQSSEAEIIVKKIKIINNVAYRRKLILEAILSLHREVSGDFRKRLELLYRETGLIHYSFKKINHKKWDIKIKGVKELAQMRVKKGVYDKVKPFITDKNPVLREEMQLSMVRLFGEEGLGFLDNSKFELSEWLQLELIQTLSLHKKKDLKFFKLKNWLQSQHIYIY